MPTDVAGPDGADDFRVVRKSFDAITRGDMELLASCFAASAVVWHNHDEAEQTIAQASAVLRHLYDLSHRIAYIDQTMTRAGNLVFSRHVLTADLRNGKHLRMPAMMEIRLDSHGLIERIDEYLDSRAIDVLMD